MAITVRASEVAAGLLPGCTDSLGTQRNGTSMVDSPGRHLPGARYHVDQELIIQDETVSWCVNGVVHKQYRTPAAVVQGIWCRFNAADAGGFLCTLHKKFLTVYARDSGEPQIIPSPPGCTSVWPLPHGVLLTGMRSPCILSHPLEDLHVLDDHTGNLNFHEERVVWSSMDTPYVATYNLSAEQLRIWKFHSRSEQRCPPAHGLTTPQPISSASRRPGTPTQSRKCGLRQHDGSLSPLAFQATASDSSWSAVREGFFSQELAYPVPEKLQPADDSALSHDTDGSLLLCLLSKPASFMLAVRLPQQSEGRLEVAFTLQGVVSMTAVLASRDSCPGSCVYHDHQPALHDLLVVHTNGRLALYIGDRLVCHISADDAMPDGFFTRVPTAHVQATISSIGQLAVHAGGIVPCGMAADTVLDEDRPSASFRPLDPFANVQALGDALDYANLRAVVHVCQHGGNQVAIQFNKKAPVRIALGFGAIGHLTSSTFAMLRPVLPAKVCGPLQVSWMTAAASSGDGDVEWQALGDLLLAWPETAASMEVDASMPSMVGKLHIGAGSCWERLSSSQHNRPAHLLFPWSASGLDGAFDDALPAKQLPEMPAIERHGSTWSISNIVGALTAVYQECKLHVLQWRLLPLLAKTSSQLALIAGLREFIQYYQRELKLAQPELGVAGFAEVHDMFTLLGELLNTGVEAGSGRFPMPTLKRSADVAACYSTLGQAAALWLPSQQQDKAHVESIVRSIATRLIHSGWTSTDLDNLPFGTAGPIKHLFRLCGESPPDELPEAAYAFMGRHDIAAEMGSCKEQAVCSVATSRGKTASAQAVHNLQPFAWRCCLGAGIAGRPYMQHLSGVSSGYFHASGRRVSTSAGDGMEYLDDLALTLRFGEDHRLQEVRGLLRSSSPLPLLPSDPETMSDVEGAQRVQAKLNVLATRTTSLGIGRGALTLATTQLLPTQRCDTPQLCLAARLPEQHNAIVNLHLTGSVPAPGGGASSEMTAWPEFHNGVAAALRLACDQRQLRTWILYNKPDTPSYSHAGFVMGLGLAGHLDCLAATDLYRYLSQEHAATVVATLLGTSSAKRASLDPTISKMLFLHIPARHRKKYPEIEISPLVQTAALVGVGLLYQGSNHSSMVEILLQEISGPGVAAEQYGFPRADQCQICSDREGYSLAAGFALGLVTLASGRRVPGLADLQVENRLRYLMAGGALYGGVSTRHGLQAAKGCAQTPMEDILGGAAGLDCSLGEPAVRLTSSRGPSMRSSGAVAEELAAAQGTARIVLEGDLVDREATAAAASVALGLMYMQTNDATVAALFKLPETCFALDLVKPEQLTVLTMMRSLIMWTDIRPSVDWVYLQLPCFLKGPMGALLATSRSGSTEISDWQSVAQGHCHAIAGVCIAVGLRYGGTANCEAKATLQHFLTYFIQLKSKAPEPGAGASSSVNREVLESCSGSVALALAVVMAGSGDIATFKLLRGLSKRRACATSANTGTWASTSFTYGAHTAINMSVGFLFLGAGSLTFSRSPSAVAALVIAMFPKFPRSSHDNRYYLQALRHLYVLATEPRGADAIKAGQSMQNPC